MFRKLLGLTLLLCSTAAQGAWREASSKHFVVYSEGSAESLEEFATRLERYDAAMRWLRGLEDPDLGKASRLTVYVVSGLSDVNKLAGNSNVAGFYVPRAGGSIAIVPRRSGRGEYDLGAETILLHEYAHHFMYNNFPGAFPAWFREGFAEFNAAAIFEKDGAVGLGAPAKHRGYALHARNPLSLEKMLAADHPRLKDYEVDSLYGRGWLLTHMLTFEREGQLSAYLNAINAGTSPLEAARTAFGDLKQLDKDLNKYLERRKMTYFHISADRLDPEPVTIRELSAAEDAIMEVRIRSDRGVTSKEAEELLPRARKAAAPFPDSVAAQTMLAEAEYDAGNLAEALAAAERALKVNPKSVEALLYKARVQMDQAKTPADWKLARRSLVAANRIDPTNPEPLILFYHSFKLAGEEPTENAAIGLNEAFALAPHDTGLRLTAARQFLVDGNVEEARAALKPVAYDPHSGKLGEMIESVLVTLQSNEAAKALATWDGLAKQASGGAAAGSE